MLTVVYRLLDGGHMFIALFFQLPCLKIFVRKMWLNTLYKCKMRYNIKNIKKTPMCRLVGHDYSILRLFKETQKMT